MKRVSGKVLKCEVLGSGVLPYEVKEILLQKMSECLKVEGVVHYSGDGDMTQDNLKQAEQQDFHLFLPLREERFLYELFNEIKKVLPSLSLNVSIENEKKWFERWRQSFSPIHCDPWPAIYPIAIN